MYSVIIEDEAKLQFRALDNSIKLRILKKISQMSREDLKPVHLQHGFPFFKEEVGQHRIGFKIREDLKEKRIYFIGDHKEYEKWCNSQI